MFNFPFSAWWAVIFPVVARLFLGEDLPIADSKLVKLQKTLENISDINSEIDINNPLTWPSVVSHLIERNLKTKKGRISWGEFKEQHDYQEMEVHTHSFLMKFIKAEAKRSRTIVTLMRANQSDCYLLAGGLAIRTSERWPSWYTPSGKDLSDFQETIFRYFWNTGNFRVLDSTDGGDKRVLKTTLEDAKYYGPLKSKRGKIERLYYDDKKWTIALQGRPGVGKTTFCYDFASAMNSRTLILTSDYVSNMSRNEWDFIQEYLSPEVLIMNDVDRVESFDLKKKLSYLESRNIDVDLVLMTTNYMDQIPPAVKRPGRIDHIVEMKAPKPEIRKYILHQMGKEVGVEHIPKKYYEKLDQIQLEGSPAHLKEVLRRAKNWGWDDEEVWDIHNLEGEEWEYTPK